MLLLCHEPTSEEPEWVVLNEKGLVIGLKYYYLGTLTFHFNFLKFKYENVGFRKYLHLLAFKHISRIIWKIVLLYKFLLLFTSSLLFVLVCVIALSQILPLTDCLHSLILLSLLYRYFLHHPIHSVAILLACFFPLLCASCTLNPFSHLSEF